MMKKRLAHAWATLLLSAAIVACSKLDTGGGSIPIPTPTASATTSPSPGPCGTPNSNPDDVVVAMGNNIAATYTTTYGVINGYSVIENDNFSSQAMLIDQWYNPSSGLQPITSKNVLQFTNVDSAGALHSAVGFKGAGFPPVPYTFPTAAASPVATAVSTTKLWSTGRVAAPPSGQCYSQTFTLSPGTYYFGDLDYYSLTNFRDVLIVATPAPLNQSRR